MHAYWIMLRKEWLELKRSYKFIIMPIAYLIIMLTLPIVMKLLPDLIEQDLPKGTIIEIPESTASDILTGMFSNFEQLGIIALILFVMGSISGEREKGIAPMVLSKPISRFAYFSAKWTIFNLLSIISYMIGLSVTLYYTRILFDGQMDWLAIMKGNSLLLLILILCVTITLFYSAFCKSTLMAGFLSYATYLAITKVGAYLPSRPEKYTPSYLIERANEMMTGSQVNAAASIIGTVVILSILFSLANSILKRQEI